MNFELTHVQAHYKDEFRAFTDEHVIPYAHLCDKEERLLPEIIDALREKGYLGAMLPQKYGGLEMDNITIGLMNEELGRGCSSTRSLLTVHGMVALAILRWGTEEQKEKWLRKLASGEIICAFGLTEPGTGSDAKSIETTAEKANGCFILNGKKKWITMGQIAHLFLIFAKCRDKAAAFLVERDTPGFSIKPISGLIGARGSMLSELSFENCIVDERNILGNIGTGLSHIALSSLDYGRYTIAWGCVGLGQACIDDSISYARERKQFGSALRQHQLIQKMVAEMVVDVKAARMLCYNAGCLKDAGDPDSIMETWTAKYYASKMVNRVAGYAVQIHGANGCCSNYPIERYFRDAKINEIIEGTSQMHEILIASNAFRGR